MIWRAGLALVLAAMAGAGATATARKSMPTASHCARQERVVYSCRFGRKTASLCLGPHSLHYRFGPIGKPEIDLASLPDWSNVRIHMLYSNAMAQEHIRMSKGPISYIVHSGETGNLSDIPGRHISGVVVIDGPDKTLAELTCKSSAQINFAAFNSIPRSAPEGWESGEDKGGPFDGYF